MPLVTSLRSKIALEVKNYSRGGMLEIGPEFGQMGLILKENRKHKSLVTETLHA